MHAEAELLRSAGHDVIVKTVTNDEIKGFSGKLKAFLFTPYNKSRISWMKDLLRVEKPDIVHIHNFFPILSPSVHDTAHKWGVPVVQTLHNYRTICASALLMRDGRVCEKCIDGSNFWGVLHRCYRGSFLGSFALYRLQEKARHKNIWKNVSKFIVLSEVSKEKFLAAGFNEDQLVVKPNFLKDPGLKRRKKKNGRFIYVGRLSEEKGLRFLINAWKKQSAFSLDIVGSGPMEGWIRDNASENITLHGNKSHSQVLEMVQEAICLIFPSIWNETFGLTIIEAFSVGTPVVASNLGAPKTMVVNEKNGFLFEPNSSGAILDAVDTFLRSDYEMLYMGAEETYKKHYSSEANLAQLERIYTQLLK